jgi:hypothetical protein
MRTNAQGLVALSLVVLGCGGRARTDADGSEAVGGAGGKAGGPGAGGAGGASDPAWGCLDQPQPPSGPGPYSVRIRVVEVANSIPVQGAEVALCRRISPECATPDARSLTDDDGQAAFEVAGGGSSFVRIITKNHPALPPEQQLLPAYYFFNPPIASDLNVNVSMMTSRLQQMFNRLVEVQQLPDRGMILVNALDCRGLPAPGVVFRSDRADELATPFYVEGGVPIRSRSSTNSNGFGGLVNVPAGITMVSGEIAASGRTLGEVSLIVWPNSLVQTRLVAVGQ